MNTETARQYRYVYPCKVLRVIDGDTVVLEIDMGLDIGVKAHMRFFGVNTPERDERSTEFVRRWVEQNPVLWVETYKDRTGKFGRYLGTLYNDRGESLTEKLFSENLGVPFP